MSRSDLTTYQTNLIYLRQMRALNNPESDEIVNYIVNNLWKPLPAEILAQIDVQQEYAREFSNEPGAFVYSDEAAQSIYENTFHAGLFDLIKFENIAKIAIGTLLLTGIIVYVNR